MCEPISSTVNGYENFILPDIVYGLIQENQKKKVTTTTAIDSLIPNITKSTSSQFETQQSHGKNVRKTTVRTHAQTYNVPITRA